eukprot:TRINITY_DN20270_c0_g4_i5.p1 TRINITY_DN20270_c0_g4~~TRINITY_DN20270_c0_g4_i5.p1  ORF type:complete len:299 (-),score=63.40 TRINITY_DN20270_c0_g4_i5:82-978(-)
MPGGWRRCAGRQLTRVLTLGVAIFCHSQAFRLAEEGAAAEENLPPVAARLRSHAAEGDRSEISLAALRRAGAVHLDERGRQEGNALVDESLVHWQKWPIRRSPGPQVEDRHEAGLAVSNRRPQQHQTNFDPQTKERLKGVLGKLAELRQRRSSRSSASGQADGKAASSILLEVDTCSEARRNWLLALATLEAPRPPALHVISTVLGQIQRTHSLEGVCTELQQLQATDMYKNGIKDKSFLEAVRSAARNAAEAGSSLKALPPILRAVQKTCLSSESALLSVAELLQMPASTDTKASAA